MPDREPVDDLSLKILSAGDGQDILVEEARAIFKGSRNRRAEGGSASLQTRDDMIYAWANFMATQGQGSYC